MAGKTASDGPGSTSVAASTPSISELRNKALRAAERRRSEQASRGLAKPVQASNSKLQEQSQSKEHCPNQPTSPLTPSASAGPIASAHVADSSQNTPNNPNGRDSRTTIQGALPGLPRTSVGIGFTPITYPDQAFHAKVLTTTPYLTAKPMGIANIINHCYRNACLTMLLTSQRFLAYLRDCHIPELRANQRFHTVDHVLNHLIDISCAMEARPPLVREDIGDSQDPLNLYVTEFWQRLCNPDSKHRGPNDFVANTRSSHWISRTERRELRKTCGRGYEEQKDANEWISWLFTVIDEQLGDDDPNGETPEQTRFRWVLQMNLAARTACPKCEWTVRNRNEINIGWSQATCLRVYIPEQSKGGESVSLESCIADAMVETFHTLRRCSRCKNEIAGPRISTIRRAPEILIVNIQRAQSTREMNEDGNTVVQKKCEAVGIPTRLDVTQWLEPQQFGKGSKVVYNLHGVVSHRGTSVISGHYVSYVRCGNFWKEWFKMDDDKVTRCSPADFDDNSPGRWKKKRKFEERFTPYMMLYELDHDSSIFLPGRPPMNVGEGADVDEEPETWLPGTLTPPTSSPVDGPAHGFEVAGTTPAGSLAATDPGSDAVVPGQRGDGTTSSQSTRCASSSPSPLSKVPSTYHGGAEPGSPGAASGSSGESVASTKSDETDFDEFSGDEKWPKGKLSVQVYIDGKRFACPDRVLKHVNKAKSRKIGIEATLEVPLGTAKSVRGQTRCKRKQQRIDLAEAYVDAEIKRRKKSTLLRAAELEKVDDWRSRWKSDRDKGGTEGLRRSQRKKEVASGSG